jgi:hypothetical protein
MKTLLINVRCSEAEEHEFKTIFFPENPGMPKLKNMPENLGFLLKINKYQNLILVRFWNLEMELR